MTTKPPTPAARPGGVDRCVAVCTGHRCGALLGGPAGGGLPALRAAVGDSTGALLVSTGCLGGCAAGPLMAVSTTSTTSMTSTASMTSSAGAGSGRQHAAGSAGSGGADRAAGEPGRLLATSTCWLGPMDAALIRSLARWLRAGGPCRTPLPADLARVRLQPHGAAT